MNAFGEAYGDTVRRVADLVGGIGEDEAARIVPACPEWTVRDTVAHLTGVAVDTSRGNLEGVGSEVWTQRQLDERKDASIPDLLKEWEAAAEQIVGALEFFPKVAASLMVGDTVVHEHDIRLPLQRPGARDAAAVPVATDGYVRWFGRRIKERELPPVTVKADGREWVAGAGEPDVEVEAPSTFELLRALTGRRTTDEVASFRWKGDPAPYLGVFSMYGMRSEPLGE